ncbi:TMEM175 family protein [Haladaptatus pallidirubidus]|uniref:TMEM175 family protein n=1 Tax=Haladaptatus pallidirubidus TaxID=1008152 RepID=A0AAV3UFF5_9EURY|nr:TMEM175 family protein [Haladaptatus pallidirubidus]
MVRVVEGEGTDRIEAISDGVFAIVLTLLVLQFEVPTVPPAQADSQLPSQLLEFQSLLFSYLLSFFAVGLYWVIHQNIFQQIEHHDRILLYLNLLFLLTISFLPFPTELVGTYSTRLTWGLYATNFALVGVTMTATWWYAARRGFTTEEISTHDAWLISLRGLTAPAVFLFSMLVSVVSLNLAYWTPLLIVPLQVWWVRRYRSLQDEL